MALKRTQAGLLAPIVKVESTAPWWGRTGLLASAVAALVSVFTCAPAGAQEVEVRWTEAGSGTAEVRLGESFDLDFRNPKASGYDFQFEPWEGGSFWSPAVGCKAGLTSTSDFAALPIEQVNDVPLTNARVYLCGGPSGAVKPGTILIATTSDVRYAKVSIDACGETLKFHYIIYDRKVIKLAPAAAAAGLDAPLLTSPPDGIAFDHSPRDLLLTWKAVPGASSYTLELDCRGCCGPRKEMFCAEQENGKVFVTVPDLMTSAYYTLWQGAYAGRWRVSAVASQKGPDGKPHSLTSPWSGWMTFSFKK